MALNVKMAMFICMGFIAGMSWLVQRVSPPQLDAPAPPAVDAGASAFGGLTGNSDVGAVAADRRVAWAGRLERANPLDEQLDANRSLATAVTVMEAPPDETRVLPPIMLPPLAYESGEFAESPLAAGVDVVSADIADGSSADALGLLRVEPEAVSARALVKRHRVLKGDTLAGIARREWDSGAAQLVQRLVDANPQLAKRRNRLVVGEELIIPTEADGNAVAATGALPPDGRAAATIAERWYTIRRNDSLQSIARRHLNDDRRWREIMRLNGLASPSKIQPGQRIKLPPTVELASR